MVAKGSVLEAFEVRFDHLSARAVMGEALEIAGLADRAGFEPKELEALAKVVAGMDLGRVDGLVAALGALGAAPAAPKAAPAAAPQAEEAPDEPEPEAAEPAAKAAPPKKKK